MFKNIIDFKILNLYSKDYSSSYSIREITKILNINYEKAYFHYCDYAFYYECKFTIISKF